ncbi:ABC transporter ATP-binding protein [Hydrogenophaga sp. Root209]|uniref:ABC transporter ATP-binding protein n=1 Tax=Hydrogenophaga sp. Root209 TaxID=1736490 RepID=UPI0006F7E142|nr:ABC transporter ATP-binding protein [Hydrogenophaga sp. Root209]KRC06291.1 ABC transporter ATP-binding protein [Hydrogenophaga sp. Root209]
MNGTSPAMLEMTGVSKRFGGLDALAGIDLTVLPGQIYSVIGPNGAGKTTLFNMASCLLHPTTGRIRFQGEDITGLPAHALSARGMARTFQNLAVFKHESVINNILTGMHAQLSTGILGAALFWGAARRAEIAAREAAEEIVEFLEIETIRDVPVGTLSYGLQKRVELGRALAMRPRLLLLDEMVSGMNQEETEDIARFILDIREERGITVMMIEHDMGIVMDISDHVTVLNFGRKIAEGTPADVSANPAVVSAYLGLTEGPAARTPV